MAYVPNSGSVVAFQSDPTKLVATVSVVSTVPTSVSGTVGASVIGLPPVNVTNFPTNQNVSGSVVAWLQSTSASVITVGTPAVNQSVSGTVNVGNFPTTQNVSGSVVGFQGTDPWRITGNNNSIITIVQGSVATAIVSGSIAATFTPPANQSVSGTVGASVIGLAPVSVSNFPTNQNVSGSVVAFQGTSPWIITGSVQGSFSPAANQSVSGTVQGELLSTNASVITVTKSSVAVAIVSGSIAATFTPPANQSVSGTVQAEQIGTVVTSLVSTVPSSVIVGASIFGLPPVNVTNFPTNQNVSGSVVSFQGTSPWIITGSIQGGGAGVQYAEDEVVPSVTGTAVMFRKSQDSSVMEVVNPLAPLPVVGSVSGSVGVVGIPSVSGTVNIGNFPTTQNVSGSVVSFPGAGWPGSVVAFQGGTQITSLVSTVPSSVIVGASIFGLPPVNVTNTVTVVSSISGGIFPVSGSVAATITNTNVNVSGSVVAFGFPTNQNVSGSVVAFQGTNPWVIQSIVGTYAEDVAFSANDKGMLIMGVRNDLLASIVGADLDYTPKTSDSAGRTLIKPFATDETSFTYTGSVVSGSVTLIKASAVGKRSYLTDFFIANTGSVATLVTFQDGSTSIIGNTIAPAGGGSNMPGMAVPIKTAPSQDLAFKMATSASVLYVTATGYQAP